MQFVSKTFFPDASSSTVAAGTGGVLGEELLLELFVAVCSAPQEIANTANKTVKTIAGYFMMLLTRAI
jgi:hypothetical protein